jgi:hypothetical protein
MRTCIITIISLVVRIQYRHEGRRDSVYLRCGAVWELDGNACNEAREEVAEEEEEEAPHWYARRDRLDLSRTLGR